MSEDIEHEFWNIIEKVNRGEIDIRDGIRRIRKMKIQKVVGTPKRIDTATIHEFKRQGHSNIEIAVQMGISLASVFRGLKAKKADAVNVEPSPVPKIFYLLDETGKRMEITEEEARRCRVNIEKVRENKRGVYK